MHSMVFDRRLSALAVALTLWLGLVAPLQIIAQSRRQPPTTPAQNQKKNKRPMEGEKKEDQELPNDIVNKPQEAETITVQTALVNVDAVVYQKKSGQIITGLKKANFAIFEDGVQKDITNFSTPEAPITVGMLIEYSKLTEQLGYYGSGGQEPGQYEVVRPAATFLTQFVRPPNDYVSVIAFDIRPTPLTDFTNDPARIQQVIQIL